MATVFNEMEIDAIGEIMNISLGASATAVSTLLGAKVNITTPKVKVENRDEFEFKDLEPAIGVEISYIEGLDGRNIMMFSRNDVRIIVGMMMGEEIPEDQFEMDEINASAIREVMNQMMGASATALSEFLGTAVNISTPISFEVPNEKFFKDKYFEGDKEQVVVRFTLEIEGKLKSEFLNLMSVKLVKHMLRPFAEQYGLDIGPEEADEEEQPQQQTGVPLDQITEEDLKQAGDKISRPMDQNATDALLKNLKEEGSDEAQSSSSEGGALDQAAIDALKAGTASGNAGGALDQAAIDALKAGTDSGNAGGALDQAAIDALKAGTASGNAGGALDQAAIDALRQEASSADDKAEEILKENKKGLSQDEMDAIMAGLRGEEQGSQPAPKAAAGPEPAPKQAQAPQKGPEPAPVQGFAGPYPQQVPVYQAAPAQPDAMTLQLLNQMQQSQMQMLELMKSMREDEKAEAESLEAGSRAAQASSRSGGKVVKSLNSQEFDGDNNTDGENSDNREMLMKVPLEISVEIGRTKKLVKDILEFTQGSLVVLDKMAGEQADLYVNGECIAHGDIVVVEDNFGIRITEILKKDINEESL